jgi:hypothetical protein
MTYDVQGLGALDYLPYQHGTSRLVFRGPRRDLEAPYVAFLGGTQTFGKFIEQPYPLKVEHLTGVTSVNLGQINAGLDVFANETVLHEISRNARVTVLEVLGAANLGNPFYAVHPRRNDRFLRASKPLRELYPDVDFTQFNFIQHMLQHLWTLDAERFELVKRMLQRVWVRRMRKLVKKLGSGVVLLKLDVHETNSDWRGHMQKGPTFVTDKMLDRLRPLVKATVPVPSVIVTRNRQMEGMVFNLFQEKAALALQGSEYHTAVANALRPVLDRLM